MKLAYTLKQIANITNGTLVSAHQDFLVTSLVTDSRLVKEKDAFIALQGKTQDAHRFIPEVLTKKPSLIIASKNYPVPTHTDTAFILVEDTLTALQTLAKYHRLHHPLKVVAITGSNGKSTTKQMVCSICEVQGKTIFTKGNLNNQFGVPFSLLEIDNTHQFGVFELGASHVGDIAETATLVMPDVAILTNVSAAHLEFFHDLETVYKTKTELLSYINTGGTLVFNQDDAYLSRLKTSYNGKSISFGFKQGADVQIADTEKFSFIYQGKTYTFDLKLERHNKLNAAAAVSAALALGITMNTIEKGLTNFTPMPMRMERVLKGNTQFILDCYNANPASMKNALEILGKEPQKPRIAVLGDMGELGETSKHFHEEIAHQLTDNSIEYAFLAGTEMKYAYEKLANSPLIKVYYGQTPSAWLGDLRSLVKNGGTCLLKASRFMNFENIFKEI